MSASAGPSVPNARAYTGGLPPSIGRMCANVRPATSQATPRQASRSTTPGKARQIAPTRSISVIVATLAAATAG